MPKLTIGMPHVDDYDGAFFSIQDIRLQNREAMHDVELVIIDNSPNTPAGQTLGKFCKSAKHGCADLQYIPQEENLGTAQAKNAVFAAATGDAVVCIDCHVMLEHGWVQKLIDFYDANPGTKDLYTGPLLMDDLSSISTHFNNIWRGQMWGIWGEAWKCKCGQTIFSHLHPQEGAPKTYQLLEGDGSQVITGCPVCGEFANPEASNREQLLFEQGARPFCRKPGAEPFEIPMMGGGLYTCRRDAWLGFHPDMRGFGGEEGYIQAKYRKAGHKAMCLPWLRWMHRFGRPNGVPYHVSGDDKARNCAIGFKELGLDTTAARAHFRSSGANWQKDIDVPSIATSSAHAGGGCGSCKAKIEDYNLDETYQHYLTEPSDINEHFPKILEFALKCDHVTDFSSRDYSVIPLLAAKPKRLRSYNSQPDGAAFWKAEQVGLEEGTEVHITHEPHQTVQIEKTDLLFYDPPNHDAVTIARDLERMHTRVSRFIVIHDTEVFGRTGSNGGPGLKLGLMQFMAAHREWTVIYNTAEQHGLMVLAKQKQDLLKRPGIVQLGATFAKHLSEHVADGLKAADKATVKNRLDICWLCDLRTGEHCSLCGCGLAPKVKWASSRCDANKWGSVEK